MSEPLAERLSRFTPDGCGLDRDALLFAAGRASVRPQRRWQMLSGVLAACWLLTFVSLWPRTPPSAAVPLASHPSMDRMPEEDPLPTPPRQWTPRTSLLSIDVENPEPPSDEPMVPSGPPLRAFGTPPATILN
jgi:hypothetical protein